MFPTSPPPIASTHDRRVIPWANALSSVLPTISSDLRRSEAVRVITITWAFLRSFSSSLFACISTFASTIRTYLSTSTERIRSTISSVQSTPK